MRVRRRHVVHSFVVFDVLIQLGFAIAFLVDAAETNTTYDALSNHRVAVHGDSVGCVVIVTGRSSGTTSRICRIDYHYAGQSFTTVIPYGVSTTFFIDPQNTSHRMDEVSYEKGPEATIGDLVFGSVLVFGALAATVVHLEHLRERRSSRMTPRPHHVVGGPDGGP